MYETIVFPTDGSEPTIDAATHAFSHAQQYDATVHVLSVVTISSGLGTGDRDDEKLEMRRQTRQAAAEQLIEEHAPDDIETTITVEFGSPVRVITEYLAEVDADLAVMSTRAQGGVKGLIFGSITEQVIQTGDTPVLAVQR